MKFPRRYLLLIVVFGFALFFGAQAGKVSDPPTGTLQTAEGTVTSVERRSESAGFVNGRPHTSSRTVMTLREFPGVEFVVLEPDGSGLAADVRVRIETYDDVARELQRAEDYPQMTPRVAADSLSTNGKEIYTAAATEARLDTWRWSYRIASLVCWVIALGWAALALRKHLPAIRRKAGELMNR